MTSTQIINKFIAGQQGTSGNLKTNGQWLSLFGNKIAEHREDGLWVTNCGWKTRTTAKYLRMLPSVSLQVKKGKWHLSDQEWDGTWVRVNDAPMPAIDTDKAGKTFDLSKSWVASDGWRGYEQPTFAIAGANDTGTWDDSPCPSHIANEELNALKKALGKIPTKDVVCETSNVFCIHRYLVVPPFYIEQAKAVVREHLASIETQLLYAV